MANMSLCVDRVEAWMASNRLRLKSAKMELIWLCSPQRLQACTADSILLRRSGVTVQPSRQVRDLGVIVDSHLSLAAHVSHVTSVCFLCIRQLRLIRRSLTTDAAHALVRALIHSRLDYCNGLFAGLPYNQLTRLQSGLRAAARVVIRAPSRAPVSVAMRDVLHWLSFPQYVTFKLCLLTYKCLHGLAPEYLSRCCVPLTAVPGRPRTMLNGCTGKCVRLSRPLVGF